MAGQEKGTGPRSRTLSVVGIVAMTGAANVLTLVYQVLVGRELGPAAYGLFSSTFVIVGVVGVATSGLQVAAAQSLAGGGRAAGPRAVDAFTWEALRLAAAIGGVLLLLSPALTLLFRIGYEPFLVLAAYVPVAAALSIVGGRLQGRQRILAYTGFALAVAAAKVVSILPVAAVGLGSTSYLGSFTAFSLGVAAAGLVLTRRAGVLSGPVLSVHVRRAFTTMSLFWFITSVDVIAARAFLPEDDAGQWAAASVLAKSALLLPALISTAVLPLAVQRRAEGGSTDGLARRALLLALGAALLPIVFIVVAGRQVIELLYGPQYAGAGALSWELALAVVPLALAQVLLQFHLAREQGGYLRRLLLVAVIAPLALWAAAPSVRAMVLTLAAISGATLLGLVPLTKWRLLLHRQLDVDAAPGADPAAVDARRTAP